MGGNIQKIPDTEVTGVGFIGKTQSSFALQHAHPFAFVLVIPKIGWAALAGGDDPFDSQAGPGQ